ncbi:MAG: penicillin acylase family protein [Alphaproteobacteria bacterium]|nr:penicillin acylase family protein [Alphaproteobacteria bacterium]
MKLPNGHQLCLYTKRTAVVVLPLVLALVLIGVWVFKGSLPQYDGRLHLKGLSAKVHVWRDTHGVPHIFANNDRDAYRALGYIHASERLFQMEMQRRAGQGRLSEVIGEDMVGVDKFIRTLGLYPLAQSSFKAMSPDAQADFQAYADGVNAWIASHHFSLPPEFVLLGFHPEPWQPADSVVWGKLMALQLSHNYKLEILRAQLALKLTTVQRLSLFPPLGDTPVTTEPKLTGKKSADASPAIQGGVTDRWIGEDALGRVTGLDHAASNEWVVSGDHTSTGKPILANDPHLTLEAPILWYLARIVTPDHMVKGATVPGLPIVLLGQNDAIAWGFTTTGSDVQDLFVEKLSPDNHDAYLTPKGPKPFETRTETIHVKGGRDIVLKVRLTRHGPVLSDVDDEMAALAGPDKVMALAFTGLGAEDTTSESLLKINHAQSWPDFLEALRLYQGPPQNVVFADNKGDIAFINPGLFPIRKKGDGLTPSDGASGAYDWAGWVPFDEWPKVLNPSVGFIFNANNAIVSDKAKHFLGVDWEEAYRAERLQQFFNTTVVHSLDTSAAMQADHLSLAAKQLLPYLLKQKPWNGTSAEVLKQLAAWDGTMEADRPEPLIFEAWMLKLHQNLLVAKSDNALKEKGLFAATALSYILRNNGKGWCDTPGCADVIQKSLDDALVMLTARDGTDRRNWRWGNEHITLLPNKVFSHVPYFKRTTDLSVGSSGDFYTLDRGGSFKDNPDHPFARTHGGGYRAIYDLSDPTQSRFMITTGESGHILSPHYGDFVPLWNKVQYINITGSEEDLSAAHDAKLVLAP